MLTPSLVLAYWTCGSAIGPPSHREQPLRVGDALKGLLAAVVERHARRGAGKRAHRVRHQHLARRGRARDPGSDIDRPAVDVVPLADDVTGVDAQVQRQSGLVSCLPALQRRLYRLVGRREDGKDTVAEELAFDRRALALADR